jgi:glycine cleavage system H protein
VKTAADVFAPVSGEIIGHNENLKGEPALVNTAAEGDGWILKIKVQDDKDISNLKLIFTFNR